MDFTYLRFQRRSGYGQSLLRGGQADLGGGDTGRNDRGGYSSGNVRAMGESGLASIVVERALSSSKPDHFRRSNVELATLIRLTETLADASAIVIPTGAPPPCRDENDRKYLHCVTTELDLLVLEQIESTKIIRPGALWRIVSESS